MHIVYYEATEFIKCLMDSLLNFCIFYITSNNYEVAYKYAFQLNEISYTFDDSMVNFIVFSERNVF